MLARGIRGLCWKGINLSFSFLFEQRLSKKRRAQFLKMYLYVLCVTSTERTILHYQHQGESNNIKVSYSTHI